jgi:predicted PurR-regulated permease PerM
VSPSIALSVLGLVGIALFVWLTLPVVLGLLIGTLIAFTVELPYRHLAARWGRPALAAVVCTAGTAILFFVAMACLGYLLVSRGVVMAGAAQVTFAPGGDGWAFVQQIAHRVGIEQVSPEGITAQIVAAAGGIATSVAEIGARIASASFRILLAGIFAVMATHFILLHWRATTARIEALLPLEPRHTRALLEEFQRAGRSVLLGTILTGLAQGLLAGIGYWVTGVPQAAFFGALTAVASLLPAVGTALVWVPAGLYLFLTGHPTAGAAELVYGALVVVFVSDYVIRPSLVRDAHGTPALLTFVALFGGVEVMGLAGLIVGPVVMSVALAMLRIYEAEALRLRSHAVPPSHAR